ncbi:3-deoxy-D-manno-octulosonic acid kinase [Halomonas caseinilytica]|uniref:3-deoxy-D-manno-octulosonic acid kinase n=1 Tax=Halomonas caseinilytica TaxID=438744 RepID=A0A1M6WBZ6_9GAMM|nr:3-deoxy-D-manno-octulosonic acid kinase [Halomonas caseinilytica]SEM82482.1 3-deoxy-D-manno-octulosonic acid kinase [Halomonas caseinilytica]SHK91224.1 3-deoxy-D-manno-octulosonic acid kinase [Halomonas caseinilytica]
MRLATYRTGKVSILYDADSLCDACGTPQIGPHLFDPGYWRQTGTVIGEAPGRGASLFLQVGDEQWVLRPYRRGGLIARISTERYLWCGAERSRAFREMRLTAHLHALDLPVPRPVAAGVTRHGLAYEAGLITVRLPGARALADCLPEADAALLRRVGTTIRRFHDAGLDHVDLNARNLLVDASETVWLIDLDRCRLRSPGRWREANLERLARSLTKFDAPSAIDIVRQGYVSEAPS